MIDEPLLVQMVRQYLHTWCFIHVHVLLPFRSLLGGERRNCYLTTHSIHFTYAYMASDVWREIEMFYLTTHSTHFIYGYIASDIWLRTI